MTFLTPVRIHSELSMNIFPGIGVRLLVIDSLPPPFRCISISIPPRKLCVLVNDISETAIIEDIMDSSWVDGYSNDDELDAVGFGMSYYCYNPTKHTDISKQGQSRRLENIPLLERRR
jgi:hypothetical protein